MGRRPRASFAGITTSILRFALAIHDERRPAADIVVAWRSGVLRRRGRSRVEFGSPVRRASPAGDL
jgi:hypothetical protein